MNPYVSHPLWNFQWVIIMSHYVDCNQNFIKSCFRVINMIHSKYTTEFSDRNFKWAFQSNFQNVDLTELICMLCKFDLQNSKYRRCCQNKINAITLMRYMKFKLQPMKYQIKNFQTEFWKRIINFSLSFSF